MRADLSSEQLQIRLWLAAVPNAHKLPLQLILALLDGDRGKIV